jgi:threonine synthase
MWGFQAEGAAPIVYGEVFDAPETIATAIRIGNPASWAGALTARDESDGRIEAVTDDEILDAYRLLARQEGVFCEPASAAGVTGILKYRSDLPPGPVVCTVTGHGLKDPDTAVADISVPESVEASVSAVATAAGLR